MQELEEMLEEILRENMNDDLIRRRALMEEISSLSVRVTGLRAGKGVLNEAMRHYRDSVLKCINEAPASCDDWISVEECLPEPNKKVLATILHHKWISDYDSAWVPEDEKVVHEAWTETSEVVYVPEDGFLYADSECGFTNSYAQIKPEPDMSRPVDEVVAWCPMPEPYHSELNSCLLIQLFSILQRNIFIQEKKQKKH